MGIAQNLKKLRTEKGLTQDELSKLLNINRATYAHYETGRREPDLETLKILAKFFNVTLDQLASSGIDVECGSGKLLHNILAELYPDKSTKMNYAELSEEIDKNPDNLKLLQLILNNKNTYSNIDKKILYNISSLDDDLKKEAEKYIELLKLKQNMDKNKDEQSATSEKDV